jgi:hypothetical protein
MTDQKPDMAKLQKDLDEATERHHEAARRERDACRAECAARDKLNAAQKAFDAGVEALRKAAPQSSDWKQAERMRHASASPV